MVGGLFAALFTIHCVDSPGTRPYAGVFMNLPGFLPVTRVFFALCASLLAVSCSTKVVTDQGSIIKVKTYHLRDAVAPAEVVADPAVNFERQYVLHGAVHPMEMEDREGNYFSVFWKVEDRSQPVKVRFEYTQVATGLDVKTVEEEVVDLRSRNITNFSFVGNDYLANGPVTSWRASVVRGKDVLVSYNSYLWK